jgi:hypothetical protein
MIDLAYTRLTGVLVLPLAMLADLLTLLKNGLGFILDHWDRHTFRVGNRLLMMSDAAKGGTIRIHGRYRSLEEFSASELYRYEKKQKGKEDNL